MFQPRASRAVAAAAVLASLTCVLAACGGETEGAAGNGEGARVVHVIAYPGLEAAFEDSLEPAFEKTRAGRGVSFHNSFAPSAEQVREIAAGEAASIVNLEQAGEMELLVDAGKVGPDWDRQGFFSGVAAWTVIAFVVRKGNPEKIHSLRDLLAGDVDVVLPNPFASDTGRWAVMDVYATLIDEGRTEAEALAGVRKLLGGTVSQSESAAEGMATFLAGEGDVLLTYESQAIQAVDAGRDLDFVVPQRTIRVDTPIAVTTSAVGRDARHFLKFLWSGTAQALWAKAGHRPADQWFQARFKGRFPFRETLSIDSFGGWAEVNEKFFDPETGSIAEIERQLGVPIGG